VRSSCCVKLILKKNCCCHLSTKPVRCHR
jgi:hypothetical protein